jgi:DNA helicase-2/ATP-dependent DNA helicase PcrA
MTNDAILDDLNDAQRQAVTHGGGPLLVIAGAGSGKTRVITRRIAWLVREGVPDHGVLAITFTNKAAAEMRERVDRMLGRSRTWISTFHAFGARILRLEAQAAGLDSGFTILDESDRLAVFKEVLKELGLTSKEHRPGDFAHFVSQAKNRGEAATAEDAESVDEYRRVHATYEAALRASQCLDFDDLLLKTVELFEHEGVRAKYQRQFRYVMIDEYQDTNRPQYLLIKHLVGKAHNLAVVGDPDQSIYKWRGADLRNILDFEQDFPRPPPCASSGTTARRTRSCAERPR